MDNVPSSAGEDGYLNGICHGENNRFHGNFKQFEYKQLEIGPSKIQCVYIYIYVYVINPISYATEVNQLNQGFVAPAYTSSGIAIVCQRFDRVLRGCNGMHISWEAENKRTLLPSKCLILLVFYDLPIKCKCSRVCFILFY